MKLFWLDLETTGLDPRRHAILEVALAIADLERPFNAVEMWSLVTKFNDPPESLDPFIVDMHTKNGLLAECRESRAAVGCSDIEAAILSLIPIGSKREDMPVLAGSTIHFDRSFLEVHMPDVAKRFSHRHYDVSSVKLFCESMGMPRFAKAEAHRAMADVRESIGHARGCASWLSRGFADPYRIPTQREAEHETTVALTESRLKATFPPFSGEKPTCRKCRHHHIVGSQDKYDPTTDTLDRTCINCRFTWVECAADSGSEVDR